MHIILGGTGHIGSALAGTLLDLGEAVTVVSRDEKKRAGWEEKGAKFALVDVLDVEALKEVLKTGERLFMLNPPAAPSTNTVEEEEKSLNTILAALEGSGIQKVVAESTYGAQPGKGLGDLGVLYRMEQALTGMKRPVSIIRGAYYMSNWAMAADEVKKTGQLFTLYPADFKLPMVDPGDIGVFAAGLMMQPIGQTGHFHVEGPEQYSPRDVADAFAEAIGEKVEVVTTPKEKWVASLQEAGFSLPAAEAMAKMTEVTLAQKYEAPNEPVRGGTTLKQFIAGLFH